MRQATNARQQMSTSASNGFGILTPYPVRYSQSPSGRKSILVGHMNFTSVSQKGLFSFGPVPCVKTSTMQWIRPPMPAASTMGCSGGVRNIDSIPNKAQSGNECPISLTSINLEDCCIIGVRPASKSNPYCGTIVKSGATDAITQAASAGYCPGKKTSATAAPIARCVYGCTSCLLTVDF